MCTLIHSATINRQQKHKSQAIKHTGKHQNTTNNKDNPLPATTKTKTKTEAQTTDLICKFY
jgi:cell division protein FtsX